MKSLTDYGPSWAIFGVIAIPLLLWIGSREHQVRVERFANEMPTWNRASQGIDRGWVNETNRRRRRSHE
jgi:hypothetical protein